MATVLWDVRGVLLVDFTPPGSIINSAAFQETLKRLKEAIRRKRPGLLTKELGALLLHDNARPHSAAAAVNLLKSWGWEILPHPPYSPDLAPSDFHLRRKSTSEVSASNPMKMFKTKSRNGYVPRTRFFYEGLDRLIYRYDKCLKQTW
jgi:hypothetical protein